VLREESLPPQLGTQVVDQLWKWQRGWALVNRIETIVCSLTILVTYTPLELEFTLGRGRGIACSVRKACRRSSARRSLTNCRNNNGFVR